MHWERSSSARPDGSTGYIKRQSGAIRRAEVCLRLVAYGTHTAYSTSTSSDVRAAGDAFKGFVAQVGALVELLAMLACRIVAVHGSALQILLVFMVPPCQVAVKDGYATRGATTYSSSGCVHLYRLAHCSGAAFYANRARGVCSHYGG